ncbi:hypothetical protein I6N90_13800 [Paenibacillus sp. GSMTC-2017]|uniref:hypothetical protein n=1 Tax=Paenibacillus sp. GSMTC-2017 TaxID=2794350 RepID=UPI0018D748D3|nr:hypothetical protein [Paenibacillus sp. GSMTC-2017]MBH5318874.1 hypothetical protein [Paenibacillus sp. GSMTC-2017]
MSQPNIPNITPVISITIGDSINLLLASIALEELALAHILNAEAEKIQFVLGTLSPGIEPPPSLSQLLLINNSVNQTLQSVMLKELLLVKKLGDIISFIPEE